MNKSPDFEEVTDRSQLDISEPYKVYRIVPEEEQKCNYLLGPGSLPGPFLTFPPSALFSLWSPQSRHATRRDRVPGLAKQSGSLLCKQTQRAGLLTSHAMCCQVAASCRGSGHTEAGKGSPGVMAQNALGHGSEQSLAEPLELSVSSPE